MSARLQGFMEGIVQIPRPAAPQSVTIRSSIARPMDAWMMRRFLNACLVLAAVASSLPSGNNSRSIVEASAQNPDGPPPRQVEREKSWPDLAARVGPYGGVSTIGTARQATGEGFAAQNPRTH
jgi:hypothetical protein